MKTDDLFNCFKSSNPQDHLDALSSLVPKNTPFSLPEIMDITAHNWRVLGKHQGAVEIVNLLIGKVPNDVLLNAVEIFRDANPMDDSDLLAVQKQVGIGV